MPAMATPLHSDGRRVNHAALRPLVEFLIEAGVSGLFVGGTTGEGILLEMAERQALHEAVTAIVAGRAPVLLHVGANTTAGSLVLAEHARSLGADAVVTITPHFYPIHDDSLLAYYQAIAGAAPDTPLMAYDIPQMAVNGIGPALLRRLAEEIPSFAGLKSSRPDAQVVRLLIDAAPPHLIVLAGNEAIALGLLALGADGLISGLATAVPEPFVALARAVTTGNLAEARCYQRQVNQILELLPVGARIGAIKAILTARGIDAGPAVPPRPMPAANWDAWPRIQEILDSSPTDR